MKTSLNSKPLLSQTLTNTTLWIGHLPSDTHDHQGGQTFTAPSDSVLDNIQIFSQAVPQPGHLQMTLYKFDCGSLEWGPAIAKTEMIVEKNDEASWLQFRLDPVNLQQNSCYGFRLETQDALIGLGEAASNAHRPFSNGLSWNGDGKSLKGTFYNFFSLAFKVEVA